MDNQLSGSTWPPFTGQLEFAMLVFAEGGKLKDLEKKPDDWRKLHCTTPVPFLQGNIKCLNNDN